LGQSLFSELLQGAFDVAESINLRERFGKRYKVTYEESYQAQHGPRAWVDDPWLMIIPCRHGHIFPWGGDKLTASTDRRGGIAKSLMGLPGVAVHQDGSDGVTAVFPVERFDAVAALLIPRRRRVVSEAERERLRAMSAQYGFRRIVGAPETSAVCVGTV
jgi:hypothetical protein